MKSHQQKLIVAKQAAIDLLSDTSVSLSTTLESLEDLAERIDDLITCVKNDIDRMSRI